MLVRRLLLRLRFACIGGLAIGMLISAAALVGDVLALGTIAYLILTILFVVGALGGEIVLRQEWRTQSGDNRPMPGSTR